MIAYTLKYHMCNSDDPFTSQDETQWPFIYPLYTRWRSSDQTTNDDGQMGDVDY